MDPAAGEKLLEPGLHVHVDADPTARAVRLAAELDADLCETEKDAEAVLADIGEFPRLDRDGIVLIRGLGGRVAAARRIVDRTVDRAALDVGQRLAATGTGVVIHPTTVRDRAGALVAARDELEAAEERLVAGQAEADAAAAAAAEHEATEARASRPLVATPVEAEPNPAARRRWFGRRGRERREDDDTRESTSLLQMMAATTDEAFGARRATAARSDHLVLLRAQRDRAEEGVRVAERAWRDLAGEAAVEDVEAVVRRFDPQHQEARAVAQDAVGVRAVATLLERALARWEEGWRSLGLEPPEAVDDGWVERMAARLVRPVVLVDEAVDWAELVVDAAPAAPVLKVERAS